MEARDLCYWLQGPLELNPDMKTLSPEQVEIIRNHLAMTLKHVGTKLNPNKPKPTIGGVDSNGHVLRC